MANSRLEESARKRIAYAKKYNAKTYVQFLIRVKKVDTDVIEKLKSVSSITQYITELIRKDIESSEK